jgi:NAD(P)-dependent dehydrogenase (short-subunit alcohol dehydrogenase family)
VHHLTKLLASEITKHELKIRINAIAPGVFPSEMTTQDSQENQKSEMPKDKMGELPAGRPGNDRDMANAILFAATNQYLNGQIVAVDGGYLLSAGA